jgi:hypothetical protein
MDGIYEHGGSLLSALLSPGIPRDRRLYMTGRCSTSRRDLLRSSFAPDPQQYQKKSQTGKRSGSEHLF